MNARRFDHLSPKQLHTIVKHKTNIKSIDKICAKLHGTVDMGRTCVEMNNELTKRRQRVYGSLKDNETMSNESDECSGLGHLDDARSPDSTTFVSHSPTFDRTRVSCEESVTSLKCREPPQSQMIEFKDKMVTEDMEQKNRQKVRHTTQYNNWHSTDMILAIKAVQSKELSMTAAAKRYGIPRTTLRHYLNDGTNKEAKRACFSLPKIYESELLNFVLKNGNNSEKTLYKMIVGKAKELSKQAAAESNEADRRTVPTPAWIRRFVYRHKVLYDLFPTFLTKLEHPLHGGRKTPTDADDYCVPFDDNSSYSDVGSVEQEKMCTEIIFPRSTSSCDVFYVPPKENIRRDEKDDYMLDSDLKYDDKNVTLLSRRNGVNPYDTLGTYSMVGEELRNEYYANKWRRSAEHVESDEERMLPYKDLLSRISRTSPSNHPRSVADTTVSRLSPDCCEDFKSKRMLRGDRNDFKICSESMNRDHVIGQQQQYVALSSVPFLIRNTDALPNPVIKSNSDLHGRDITNNVDDLPPHAPFYPFPKSYAPYSDNTTTTQPLTNGYKCSDLLKFTEYSVTKSMLTAMEREIGSDYVQLFSERYRRNRQLERLYSKWVLLKADISQAGEEP